MTLKTVINDSYYGTIGYISSVDDLVLLERYILYNLSILKEYKGIIVATNYKDLELSNKNSELWLKYFPECVIIDLEENRGHNFGTADLDNALFDYCKDNNIKWLCKSSNDIILQSKLLTLPIKKSDFYYLEGIGYGGMVNWDFDFTRIQNEYFYPQTNFYFINVSKTDYLNNKDYINETHQYIQSLENYNGKIWEHIQDWTCEDFLKNCVNRNNLSKYHLVSSKTFITLLELIRQNQIHDCSHKNIMIEGICHYQYPNNNITIL